MPFTQEQIDVLRKDLAPGRVLKTQGQSYLAAWDVRAHLTRIFGYGGWDFHVDSIDLVYGNDEGPRWTVGYRCIGTLDIRDDDGRVVCSFSDAAVGGATNQPTAESAHDLAIKSAVSGALKRCAVNLGTQFGLSLYNQGETRDVVRVLVSDGMATEAVHDAMDVEVDE